MNERTVGTVALLHRYSPMRDMFTRLCRFKKQNRGHRDPQIVSLCTARIKYVRNYWEQKHCQDLSIDLLSCPLTLVQPRFPDVNPVRLAKTLSRKSHANNPSSYEGPWHVSSTLYYFFICLSIYLFIYLWSLYIFFIFYMTNSPTTILPHILFFVHVNVSLYFKLFPVVGFKMIVFMTMMMMTMMMFIYHIMIIATLSF